MRYLIAVVMWVSVSPTSASAQWAALARHDNTLKANAQTDLVLEGGEVGAHTALYAQGGAAIGDWWLGGFVTLPWVQRGAVSTLGNLELGLITEVELDVLAVNLGIGVLPPTLVGDPDHAKAVHWGRLGDFTQAETDAVTLRFGTSLRIPAGVLFARADGGVDLVIPTAAEPVAAYLRVGVGVGVRYRWFGATVEYSSVADIVDTAATFSAGTFSHALYASLRLRTRYVAPYITFGAPLTTGVAGDVFTFGVGLTTRWTQDKESFSWAENPVF